MSTQSVLEYASRKIGGVPRLPPIVGGSGRRYWTLAAAFAGESVFAVTVAGVVPQAGTLAGAVVFQAGQSAVNDFYKDQYVLDTDTTPTSGLAAQWARISSYVGATRTATLDKPWDFSAESDVAIIQPAKIALEEDITEDVAITIPVEIDLQGHKIKGKIDVTAGNFCWVRGGSGFVTNGIQKTDFGLLKIDECTVSRRDATIYAILLTEGNNLGRCEIATVTINGAYAARRGYMGWLIYNCQQLGLSDSVGNTPARLVESIGAVAVVMVALDVSITGEFAGTVVYSSNSVTGTTYFSVQADIYLPKFPTGGTLFVTTRPCFSVWKCVAAGVINVTLSTTPASAVDVSIGTNYTDTTITQQLAVTYLTVQEMTGSVTIVQTGAQINYVVTAGQDVSSVWALIEIHGSANSTGNITMTSGQVRASSPHHIFSTYRIASTYTGTATCSTTHVLRTYSAAARVFQIDAVQGTGAPSLTCSGQHISEGSVSWTLVGFTVALATSISVGTYVMSGAVSVAGQVGISAINILSVVSGGTWTVSGAFTYSLAGGRNIAFVVIASVGTGGVLTVSSATFTVFNGNISDFILISTSAAAGSSTVSGSVLVSCVRIGGILDLVVTSAVAGITATVSGSFTASHCTVEGVVSLLVSAVGATVTGPSSTISFNFCYFISSFNDRIGAGTYTWTGATLRFRSCHVEGLMTLLLTSYTTVEAYHTRFNGNSSNKSITATGTRPTTFRFWKCSFAARYDDIQPEVLDVYDILPAQAALVQGQPVKVNAANQYQVCVAASIVDGVALAAAGGAGTILIALRQGRTYVTCKAGTANGDNLVLDLVTPTQANQGAFLAGQEIGTALEAVGAVVAGKCYTAVNVR